LKKPNWDLAVAPLLRRTTCGRTAATKFMTLPSIKSFSFRADSRNSRIQFRFSESTFLTVFARR
jgi:hypothetical protein